MPEQGIGGDKDAPAATHRRRSEMLGLALTPEEWLEQLQLECDIKRKDNARIGFV